MKLKKPKFWDYKHNSILSYLLWPLSKIVEKVSNSNKKNRKKITGIKSICVGNIYIGGTGKTSLAIEIKKILEKLNIKSCFVKKYYPNQVDELKILKEYGKVFVNKSRVLALNEAKKDGYKIAIFDDGLQDKDLIFDLNFVCFNKKKEIGNGLIIPAGPLRENLNIIKNCDSIFLNGNNEKNLEFRNKLFEINQNITIYDTKYTINNINKFDLKKNYLVFSGIGNHETFIAMLKNNNFNISKEIEYPDHYNYSDQDLNYLNLISKKNNLEIITTKKDFLRMGLNNTNYKFVDVNLNISSYENLKKKLYKFNENN